MLGELAAPILLVGGGRMGAALAVGWRKAGLTAQQLVVVEPDAARRDAIAVATAAAAVADPRDLPAAFRPAVLLIAIKPQMMAAAAAYRAHVGAETLVMSIAAGKPISSFEQLYGRVPVVRAMPNTPAAVGRGITVLCANAASARPHRELAGRLMAAVGEVVWIEDEALMHPVTALSGGGPAYVFLLIEALAEAGIEAGLPAALSMQLARTAVIGAAELASKSPEPASVLRQDVTSPAGTTAAALAEFTGPGGLQELCRRAILAAARRSRELA